MKNVHYNGKSIGLGDRQNWVQILSPVTYYLGDFKQVLFKLSKPQFPQLKFEHRNTFLTGIILRT